MVYVGGLAGELYSGTIQNCTVTDLTRLEGYGKVNVWQLWPFSTETKIRVYLGGVIGHLVTGTQTNNTCNMNTSSFISTTTSSNGGGASVTKNHKNERGQIVGYSE